MKTVVHSKSSLLLIGSGRLATHLQRYLTLLGIQHDTWNRHQPLSSLKKYLSEKPRVFLAISDCALEDFYQEHLVGLQVIHASGSFHSSSMISCHPLMTFSHELYDLDIYKKIQFAITGTDCLQNILPELPNSSFTLKAEDKALYHALCVLSSAGTQTLWNASEKMLGTLGVPSQAYRYFIQQIAHNYIQDGKAALTGPWVRQDEATITQNLKALSASPESFSKVYALLKEGLL